MALVSVIIPCFNLGKYIQEAVESVLNQSYQDFEIIIVNDGSTDPYTNDLLADYKQPKTTVISTINQGVSAARNTAIKHASGVYILPLDADDKIKPTYIEKAVEVAQNDADVKVVYCNTEYFGTSNKKIIYQHFDMRLFLLSNSIHVSGLYKRKDCLEINGYDESMRNGLEDWEFWISMLKNGGKVHKINEYLLCYRQLPNSRQTTLNHSLDVKEKTLQYIERKHIDFYIKTLGSPSKLHTELVKYKNASIVPPDSILFKILKFFLKPLRTLIRKIF